MKKTETQLPRASPGRRSLRAKSSITFTIVEAGVHRLL